MKKKTKKNEKRIERSVDIERRQSGFAPLKKKGNEIIIGPDSSSELRPQGINHSEKKLIYCRKNEIYSLYRTVSM